MSTERSEPLFLIFGSDQLLVAGIIGLLEKAGLHVHRRSETKADHASRGSGRASVSIIVLDPQERLGQVLPLVRTRTPIVLLTHRALTPAEASDALLANVVGLVNPDSGIAALIRVLTGVTDGHAAWPVEDLLGAVQYLRSSDGRPIGAKLTKREREVLILLQQGGSIRSVGSALAISPKTVEALQRGLYRKLGVHTKIQAIEAGLRFGILS
jgi:DNA-binding NarL/FixJ family response regulator